MASTVTSSSDLAIRADIVARRGDTFIRYIQFKKNGVEENMAASTYDMQVRNGNEVVLAFISSNPQGHKGEVRVEENPGGVLILMVSADHMQDIEVGTYEYDLQERKPDNVTIVTRLQGTFTITKDITVVA